MPEKVLVTREIPSAGLRALEPFDVRVLHERPPERGELLDAVRGVSGILSTATEKMDGELMDAAGEDLKVIADVAFMLLLAAARRLGEGERLLRAGRWEWWGPKQLMGRDVWGKRLGIVGFGRIGQAVARRAKGFGMDVLYYNRSRKQEAEQEFGARYLDLDELLETADFVSIHTPLTDETHHLIGETELGRMKPEAVLVNTSRGPVVDEAALADAL